VARYRKLKSILTKLINHRFGKGNIRYASIFEIACCHIKIRNCENPY